MAMCACGFGNHRKQPLGFLTVQAILLLAQFQTAHHPSPWLSWASGLVKMSAVFSSLLTYFG
eukprot:4450475-Pleurochrysis_carterae.AAC.1